MKLSIPVLIAHAYALNWGSADGAQIHIMAIKRSSHESCTASPTDALDGESNCDRCGQRGVGKPADNRILQRRGMPAGCRLGWNAFVPRHV